MLLGLGPWEVAILIGVVLILFSKRIPDTMQAIGRSLIEFRRGVRGIE